ncbi:MAG: hypothetical protein JXB42_01840 [Deltaproteobacteria bacterium]|nr:hypothetical protein [Deltaproteobacteria bacterium]
MGIGGGPFCAIGSSFGLIARHEGIWRRFSGKPLRRSSFLDASCLDVMIPGVLRVPIEVIVTNEDLRDVIRDAWGSRPVVRKDRRVMDSGRRFGPGEPEAQVFEEGSEEWGDVHKIIKFRLNPRCEGPFS